MKFSPGSILSPRSINVGVSDVRLWPQSVSSSVGASNLGNSQINETRKSMKLANDNGSSSSSSSSLPVDLSRVLASYERVGALAFKSLEEEEERRSRSRSRRSA